MQAFTPHVSKYYSTGFYQVFVQETTFERKNADLAHLRVLKLQRVSSIFQLV